MTTRIIEQKNWKPPSLMDQEGPKHCKTCEKEAKIPNVPWYFGQCPHTPWLALQIGVADPIPGKIFPPTNPNAETVINIVPQCKHHPERIA
jgi:hypothetical protein